MSLCDSIDTLAMVYFDDELVAEERRELELHLLECASCKSRVAAERADLAFLRGVLAAPRAPGLLDARIARALDVEDDFAARATRRRLTTWLVRGALVMAAAALVAVFATVRPRLASHEPDALPADVVRQQRLLRPLEVRGASTEPWLHRYFKVIPLPGFRDPNIELLGARLADIEGHSAGMLEYAVVIGESRLPLTTYIIDDIRPGQFTHGRPIGIGDQSIYLYEIDGMHAVTLVDGPLAYVFTSTRLTAAELIRLVVTSDLVGRADRGR